MEKDPNNSPTSGYVIPYAWSPIDAYRGRGVVAPPKTVPKMPSPCPCGSAECRKDYEETKAEVEKIILVLSKNK
jgi:hypothetical protein